MLTLVPSRSPQQCLHRMMDTPSLAAGKSLMPVARPGRTLSRWFILQSNGNGNTEKGLLRNAFSIF